MAELIKDMCVRGAGLIGAAAGAGMHLAARAVELSVSPRDFDARMQAAGRLLRATRPTAVNLEWAVARVIRAMERDGTVQDKQRTAAREAQDIMDEDAEWCRKIGVHGVGLIEKIAARKSPSQPVNILTHCNAGWLAFVDYGSATAPIYLAHDRGINVHVWVGETRPRNQGAALTAWELQKHGVPHTREWAAHPLSTHACCSHTHTCTLLYTCNLAHSR
jgi:methylthioribose-1-phosphate isomerase